MANRAGLRVGTDTEGVAQFNDDPMRTLLFGFRADMIFMTDFWEDSANGAPSLTTGQNIHAYPVYIIMLFNICCLF